MADAFWNGTLVIEAENKFHALFEPGIQNFVERSGFLITATSYTYWLSQFAVVGLTLLWVYFRHHDRFADFRNWLIAANLVGLLGYVLMPTAPPRMFPEWGFSDTLAEYASVNHDSGLVAFDREPVRGDAEPPCDGRADRRDRDGAPSAGRSSRASSGSPGPRGSASRSWEPATTTGSTASPASASRCSSPCSSSGAGCAASSPARRDRVARASRASTSSTASSRSTPTAAREILQRSMRGVAKTKLTPDMLTLTGVVLCLAGAVLVGFEQRNEYLFFWLGGVLFVVGSIADILDGALARAASKGTVFGAFLDSTFDRVGEAAMLAAIGLSFMHDGNEVALMAAVRGGDRLVPRLVHAREGRGDRPPRRHRLRLARRAGRARLRRPRARAVGAAPVADLRAWRRSRG